MNLSIRTFALGTMAVALFAATSVAHADPIPYNHTGTVAPFVPLTATNTGSITGYFWGGDAGDNDSIELYDFNSGLTSSAVLLNHGSLNPGDSTVFDIGVTAGDSIAFILVDGNTGIPFSSDPTVPFVNSDGINHAYVTPYLGPTDPAGDPSNLIPAGTFIGFEDRFSPPSDLDYNDDEFVFTNVSTVTPEPSSFILLGSGLLAAAGLVRRRMSA